MVLGDSSQWLGSLLRTENWRGEYLPRQVSVLSCRVVVGMQDRIVCETPRARHSLTVSKIMMIDVIGSKLRIRMQIVSLFDYTGEALKPWAEVGYECFAYDIQHSGTHRDGISFLHADLHDYATVRTVECCRATCGKGPPDLGVSRVYRLGREWGVLVGGKAGDGP